MGYTPFKPSDSRNPIHQSGPLRTSNPEVSERAIIAEQSRERERATCSEKPTGNERASLPEKPKWKERINFRPTVPLAPGE